MHHEPPVLPRRLWDLPTRVLHVSLALGLLTAWFTGVWLLPQSLDTHVLLGVFVGVVVTTRSLWGFLGPAPSRFRDFVVGPQRLLAAVREGPALRFGHDPVAGAWMFAMLALTALTAATGVLVLGGEEGLGPARLVLGVPTGQALHEVHELSANGAMLMAGLHVAAVALRSWQLKVNLPRGMVSGTRAATPPEWQAQARPGLTVALLVVLGGLGAGFTAATTPVADGRWHDVSSEPGHDTWKAECSDCHEAWHPSLLPADDWSAIVAGLSDHWGEDASLPASTARTIDDFLVANAAETFDTEASWLVRGQDGVGITDRKGWDHQHRHVSFGDETHSHCLECHEDADSGRFDGRFVIPLDGDDE